MSLNLHRDGTLVVPLGVSSMLSEAENRESLRGKGCMCLSELFTSFLAFQSLRGTRHKFQFLGCCFTYFQDWFSKQPSPQTLVVFLWSPGERSEQPETRPLATHFRGCHSATWTECGRFRDRINESKRVTQGPACQQQCTSEEGSLVCYLLIS